MNKIISLIIFTFMIAFSCGAAIAEPLQGKVEASTELPAVPRLLRKGAIFNEANLPPMGTNHGWYEIPSWLAGTWHRELQTTFSAIGPVTELSRTAGEQQLGEQVDKDGGIWECVSLPNRTIVEADRCIDYNIITDSESILHNDTEIIRRRRGTTIEVKQPNNRIAKVFQREQFDTIRPKRQGEYCEDTRLTIYNERGRRLLSQCSRCHYYQIRAFEPINIDPETGLDLHQDFKAYLMSHGLANLVPVDEPSQTSKNIDK